MGLIYLLLCFLTTVVVLLNDSCIFHDLEFYRNFVYLFVCAYVNTVNLSSLLDYAMVSVRHV